MAATPPDLVTRILAGDRKAAARAISLIEDDAPGAAEVLDALYPATGKAYRVGITGPPGAGKSTLTAALAAHLRERRPGHPVGIICVDPTSPFSGGALLGDRIRMGKVALDPGVFIRSMASRGALGGLARTSAEACDVLDAFGKETILIETVGVGQSEVEVAEAADTTVVVLSPESGDSVQTMKAGLMEIADIFVVNKADREGADKMARAIEGMLELGGSPRGAAQRSGASATLGPSEARSTVPDMGEWVPPVLQTTASTGNGVPAVAEALERHRALLARAGLLERKRRERIEQKIRLLVEERLWSLFAKTSSYDAELARWTEEVLAGKATPYAAAARLFERFQPRV
jgi:LAO/AO transport system kinase